MFEIPHPPFRGWNYAVLFLYLVGVLAHGWWVSRRVKDTHGYFTAEGRMHFIIAGLSILGTYLSAITMMALPRMSYGEDDWTWTIQLPFLVFTAVIITRFVLPRYREAGVISVYQFLEQRIHVSSRLLASFCFIVMSIGRMGLVLYLPALAFATVTGADLETTILVMGAVVTLYTILGGIEAVMWTDAAQVVILMLGTIVSVGFVFLRTGANLLSIAQEYGKFRVWVPGADFTQVVSLWLILETIFQTIRIYGTQQDVVQRYITTSSLKEANRSVWLGILGYIPLGFLFYFMGTALFAFYQTHPDPNVPLILKHRADAIYPYFVVSQLPVGLAGLVMAAFFAAAMSSIDSSMNSCSTVCVEDFYKRFVGIVDREKMQDLILSREPLKTLYYCVTPNPDRHTLLVARLLTVLWGGLATAMAMMFIGIPKAQVVWSKIMGISTNGVLGLMALAFLPFRVHRWAAGLGFGISYLVLFYMMWGPQDFLFGAGRKINFLLWPVVGNSVCFLVALLLNVTLFKGATESNVEE